MSVWLTIPSSRPPEEANPCLAAWRERGYKIALWCDKPSDVAAKFCDWGVASEYPGYANSCNHLIAHVFANWPDAEFGVIGGDDVWPDPNKSAEEIAQECKAHFYNTIELTYPPSRPAWAYDARGTWPDRCGGNSHDAWGLFGVMQPTGDRFAEGQIDRIAGSAWIGREFALRVNRGNGPLWPEYTHMFVDEELQNVAIKYGVFWQRPDLVQMHRCYARASDAIDSPAIAARHPAHITHDGYTMEHWKKYEALFLERKAEGFPGSELK